MQHEKHSKKTLIKSLESKEHSKLVKNGTTTSFFINMIESKETR